jgi:hypothetical protein
VSPSFSTLAFHLITHLLILSYIANFSKICDLFTAENTLKSVEDIHQLVKNHSPRLLSKEYSALVRAIPKVWTDVFQHTSVSSGVCSPNKSLNILDPFDEENSFSFESMSTMNFYYLLCRKHYKIERIDLPCYKWKDLLLSDRYSKTTLRQSMAYFSWRHYKSGFPL